MKKFLALVSVVAVAGVVSTASAMDRTGKIGLGVQESFSGSGNLAPGAGPSLGSWSLKYGISDMLTGQLTVGFDVVTEGGNNVATFGGRVLYDLVQNENSDFYTGLGIGYLSDSSAYVLRFQLPLGYEFSFSGLPEIGFSLEAGVVIDYGKGVGATPGAKGVQFSSAGGQIGGNLGLGVHYYF